MWGRMPEQCWSWWTVPTWPNTLCPHWDQQTVLLTLFTTAPTLTATSQGNAVGRNTVCAVEWSHYWKTPRCQVKEQLFANPSWCCSKNYKSLPMLKRVFQIRKQTEETTLAFIYFIYLFLSSLSSLCFFLSELALSCSALQSWINAFSQSDHCLRKWGWPPVTSARYVKVTGTLAPNNARWLILHPGSWKPGSRIMILHCHLYNH